MKRGISLGSLTLLLALGGLVVILTVGAILSGGNTDFRWLADAAFD